MYKALWRLNLLVSPFTLQPHLRLHFCSSDSQSGCLRVFAFAVPTAGTGLPHHVFYQLRFQLKCQRLQEILPTPPILSETPKSQSLALFNLISLINKILLFTQLSISSLPRMNTTGTGPSATCSTPNWCSTFAKWKYKWTWLNFSVPVLERGKPLLEVMFPFLPSYFHLTDHSLRCHFICNNKKTATIYGIPMYQITVPDVLLY